MKIICVGRNYAEHARELGNEVAEEPVLFMKPDSAVMQRNNPFVIPTFSNDIHYECELLLKIGRHGKCIEEEFAYRYISEIGLGIDFTARDVQQELKAKALPWEKAKAFDGSAYIGDFKAVTGISNLGELKFELHKNDAIVQSGNTANMVHSIPKLIAYISQYFSLKIGDIIFTGTPSGVGPVRPGDELKGFLEGQSMFRVRVR
ncbi:MAG: fumarylacetoacetate hydrolase family protein [Bacteroidetes bacterium]|nr:fumarylacetoacetate hydrolase family protein [Bacteroidota bacterium]